MIPCVKVKLPTRSRRYGVGKEIGGAVYVHRNYASIFGADVMNMASRLPPDFEFAVVKYQVQTGAVTFIECPTFDTLPEPVLERTCRVRPDGISIVRQPLSDPYIYHHKWLFVDDDYIGFDVEDSRRRSQAWMQLPSIDYAHIGRRSFWLANVAPLLQETG
jgi:hypothetical protein